MTEEFSACYLLHADFLLGLFFCPEDGGDMFLRNVGGFFSRGYTALYPRTTAVTTSNTTKMTQVFRGFLPNHFEFTNQQPSYDRTLYILMQIILLNDTKN
jgi:hypothetical protein